MAHAALTAAHACVDLAMETAGLGPAISTNSHGNERRRKNSTRRRRAELHNRERRRKKKTAKIFDETPLRSRN